MKKVKFGEICDIFSAGDKPKIFSEIKTEECSVPVYGNGMIMSPMYMYPYQVQAMNAYNSPSPYYDSNEDDNSNTKACFHSVFDV